MIGGDRVRPNRALRRRSGTVFGQASAYGFGGGGNPGELPISFSAVLQSTLVPAFALGSDTPTFTRATTAYVADWENLLKPVLSGEARFTGARRVRNLISTKSEDFSNAAWVETQTGTAAAGVKTNNFGTAPDGTQTAARIQLDVSAGSAGNQSQVYNALSVQAATCVYSSWIKTNDGSTVTIKPFSASGVGTMTINGSWQRFSSSLPTQSFLQYILVKGTTSDTADLLVWHPQAEDAVGQSNQNPSEYVSVGVLSAPYHGAGVDGVKYFTTLNGNTVASNVVTEATGAAITSANGSALTTDAGGPFGYFAEGARTNVLLQSQTFGTTWTISNAADMNAVTADQYVAPDGTTTMDLLNPKATTAVHSLNQAFTFTAAVYTCSFYLRYVPATPQRWVALVLNDGTTTWAASFDLLNGAAGVVSNCTSTIEATGIANVYRVTMTKSAAAAAAAGTVKISLNETDTASLESGTRAGTETLGAWGGQLEAASFASSYIPTTTSAVARNADELTYPLAGNFSATAGSIYAESSLSVAGIGPDRGVVSSSTDASGRLLYFSSGTPTTITAFDGTNLATANGTSAVGAVIKVALSYSGTSMQAFNSGNAGTAATFAGFAVVGGNLRVGDRSGAGNELHGTTRNLRIYAPALSASQLEAMTA